MYKLPVLLILLSAFNSISAQKVFSVEYANQADVKVFVVRYENQADLKIYFVEYENQAGWRVKEKNTPDVLKSHYSRFKYHI